MKLARKRAKSGRKFKKKGDDVRNPKTWNLEEKREIAKLAIVGSMVVTVATSFAMRNRTMRRLHIGAGAALVGFSLWHQALYQKGECGEASEDKKPKAELAKVEAAHEVKKVRTKRAVRA